MLTEGKIIVADDQKINLEAIRVSLESVGIENAQYCADGEIALDVAFNFLKEAVGAYKGVKLKPISAMLLDIQMPMKSGLQVVSEVTKFCALHKEKLFEPIYIYHSAYVSQTFKDKIEKSGNAYCFEKPMQRKSLIKMLELIKPQKLI